MRWYTIKVHTFHTKELEKKQILQHQNKQLLVIFQQTLAYLYKCYSSGQGFKSSDIIYL